jgi:Ca2+-binding RTX toxin-like protein
VVFKPGFLQPYNFFDPAIANQDRLFGTINGVLNIPGATFDLLDGVDWNGAVSGLENSVSIGEGGRLAFTLSTAISPSGLYLYVADVGGGNDDFRVRVSDSLPNLSAGLTLTGTDGDDIIDLLKGFNAALGLGNDILNGGDGNDTILSGAGDDTVGGDAGNDILNCGVGNDTVTGGTGTDQLVGDVGNDILNGGEDNDTIDCGKGNDRVVAALGNDRVTLGKGKDICEVIRGIGVTKILDFRDRQDRIDLAKGIKFGKLDIDQRGRNTKISINGDPLAVLINVQVSVLTAADFT